MKELIKALADFQSECPPFIKNIDGFKYKYTALPEIIKEITPLLRTHGLMVYQQSVTREDYIGVRTVLNHIETGQELISELVMPLSELNGMNLYQSAGSAITYIRRYDLSNLLGLLSEKDDDGGSGKTAKRIPVKTVATPEPKKTQIVLTPTHAKWADAVKYVKNGGKIEDVKKGYSISDLDLAKLKKEAE